MKHYPGMWGFLINHYMDPHWTTSLSWKVMFFFVADFFFRSIPVSKGAEDDCTHWTERWWRGVEPPVVLKRGQVCSSCLERRTFTQLWLEVMCVNICFNILIGAAALQKDNCQKLPKSYFFGIHWIVWTRFPTKIVSHWARRAKMLWTIKPVTFDMEVLGTALAWSLKREMPFLPWILRSLRAMCTFVQLDVPFMAHPDVHKSISNKQQAPLAPFGELHGLTEVRWCISQKVLPNGSFTKTLRTRRANLILNVRLAKSFKISMSTTGSPPKLEGFPEPCEAILGVGFRLHKPYPYSLCKWVPPL